MKIGLKNPKEDPMRYATVVLVMMALTAASARAEERKRNVNVFGPAVINCGRCVAGVERAPKISDAEKARRRLKALRQKRAREENEKLFKRVEKLFAERTNVPAPPPLPPPAPAPVPPAPVIQTVTQTVNPPPAPVPQPIPPPAPAPKEEKSWWQIGAGMLMMGMYMGDRSDLLFGPYGEFGLRLGEYVRLSAKLGYEYAVQDSRHTLLIGGSVGVRLMERLYLSIGLDTLWGGLDGLEAKERRLLAEIGVEAKLTGWLAISGGFLLGHRLEAECKNKNKGEGQKGSFDGGNYIVLKIYFSSF